MEYIHKDKAQKIYKDIAESSLLWLFKEMPLDKLKKLISFKETDPDKEEEWKNKDQVEMLCHLRDTNSLLLCHLEIGPKPVDDTFTLNFAVVAKRVLRCWRQVYYQQDNELYTSAGMLSIYRAVLSVDKTKLAMDLNRFSVNFICMFTQ
jgi:hypothetical protein